MIDYGRGMVGFILTLISLFNGLLACIVSFIISSLIICHLRQHHHHHLKREEKITLILSFHIYGILLINTMIIISINIQTLIGDVYGYNFHSSWCIFQEYAMYVTGCAMYQTFVMQVNMKRFVKIDLIGIQLSINSNGDFFICRVFFVSAVLSTGIIDGFNLTGL